MSGGGVRLPWWDLARERLSREGRWVCLQVEARRVETGEGYEMREASDWGKERETLRELGVGELREWARQDARGNYRFLRSAPDLRLGWRVVVKDEVALCEGLDELYPGALADWAAWEKGGARATSYEEFTGRQTGMYRATAGLGVTEASDVAGVCCSGGYCLRRREWTVGGELRRGAVGDIPCLEPCGIVLELARRVARWERDEARTVMLRPGEWGALRGGGVGEAVGDGYQQRLRSYVVTRVDRVFEVGEKGH